MPNQNLTPLEKLLRPTLQPSMPLSLDEDIGGAMAQGGDNSNQLAISDEDQSPTTDAWRVIKQIVQGAAQRSLPAPVEAHGNKTASVLGGLAKYFGKNFASNLPSQIRETLLQELLSQVNLPVLGGNLTAYANTIGPDKTAGFNWTRVF